MPRVRVQALAKINLGLRVIGRRPDGYHELRTIFQTISLADELEVSCRRALRARVELSCNWPQLETEDNLAARAARRLLEAAGSTAEVRIRLEKRIPAGAGLGGGSSDAAATLLALGGLLRPRPSFALLAELAAELGSDVPFFLLGGRALGVGRGSEVHSLPDQPARWVLVIAPGFAVSTAEAYRRLSADLTTDAGNGKIDRFCSSIWASEQGLTPESTGRMENDFEAVVFRMHPELETLKARLSKLGARSALLCGSGSAVFGVYAGRRQALRARDSLEGFATRCFVARTVGRRGYRERWRRRVGDNWLGWS